MYSIQFLSYHVQRFYNATVFNVSGLVDCRSRNILTMSQKRRPQENLALTVKITPSRQNKVEDEEAFAILAPFNPFPRVEFYSIKLNSQSCQRISLVSNGVILSLSYRMRVTWTPIDYEDKIIRLLMCYNPLWLRLCLEAIFQCNIHLKCHSDQAGLKNFIRTRVVSDEFIKCIETFTIHYNKLEFVIL